MRFCQRAAVESFTPDIDIPNPTSFIGAMVSIRGLACTTLIGAPLLEKGDTHHAAQPAIFVEWGDRVELHAIMTKQKKDAHFGKAGSVETTGYRGPDRRSHNEGNKDPEIYQTLVSTPGGDVILDVRTKAQRRREDDMTVNLLKCLDISDLSIEDFDD